MSTEKTFTAKVRQFLLPHGRQQVLSTELPREVEAAYRYMHSEGCELQAEVLRTGLVSVTITGYELGDIDIRIVPNGPQVQEALADMLTAFSTIYNKRLNEEADQSEVRSQDQETAQE